MRRIPTRSAAGFTIIELAMAILLLTVVLGGVTMALQHGLNLFETTSLTSNVNAQAGRAMDRIVRELRASSRTTFAQNLDTPVGLPTVWSSRLDFQQALDWNAGAVVWSPPRRIDLQMAAGELDNGLDDNGDGLVDERSVVLITDFGLPTQTNVVLVNGVTELLENELPALGDDNGNTLEEEAGFCVSLAGNALTIRLSIARMKPDGVLAIRTHQDTILLRN